MDAVTELVDKMEKEGVSAEEAAQQINRMFTETEIKLAESRYHHFN